MQLAFEQHIKSQFPFLYEQKILVAVSSGIDSMVLTDLCLKSGLNIALAHCNFKLRKAESDKEEAFVLDYAKTLKKRNSKWRLTIVYLYQSYRIYRQRKRES